MSERAGLRPPKLRRRSQRRGVALVMVLSALTILTVMLAEFQDESAAELSNAVAARDQLKAEYAARSAVNLSRLLIAAEPTVRKALAPLFLLMPSGPPQIPVWEFADQVLGAFEDSEGQKAFESLAGLTLQDTKNLGLDGAGFEITVVDEDAKINVNAAARGDVANKLRVAGQILGLLMGPQHDPLFESRDPDGQFSDRQTICGAIIDWVDPDQDGFACDVASATAQQAAAEDSVYQLLDPPYQRKNAAFDSLEELRMVRGIGDDFWATFVEPEPDDPKKRTLTVWSQGKINVNTANPQTILAVICSPDGAPASLVCTDFAEATRFLGALQMVRTFTAGAPLFGSPKGFINALAGKGMFGTVLAALGLQPMTMVSPAEMTKKIATESKVFSMIATGVVKSGKRETRATIKAVVDFHGAPPPAEALDPTQAPATPSRPAPNQPASPGLTGDQQLGDDGIAAAFQPSAGGRIVYYRVE